MMRVGSKPRAFLRLTLLLWHEERVTKERSWRGKRHKAPFHPGLPFFLFGYTLRDQSLLLLKNMSYIEMLLYIS